MSAENLYFLYMLTTVYLLNLFPSPLPIFLLPHYSPFCFYPIASPPKSSWRVWGALHSFPVHREGMSMNDG